MQPDSRQCIFFIHEFCMYTYGRVNFFFPLVYNVFTCTLSTFWQPFILSVLFPRLILVLPFTLGVLHPIQINTCYFKLLQNVIWYSLPTKFQWFTSLSSAEELVFMLWMNNWCCCGPFIFFSGFYRVAWFGQNGRPAYCKNYRTRVICSICLQFSFLLFGVYSFMLFVIRRLMHCPIVFH